jgi:hypothetical protein
MKFTKATFVFSLTRRTVTLIFLFGVWQVELLTCGKRWRAQKWVEGSVHWSTCSQDRLLQVVRVALGKAEMGFHQYDTRLRSGAVECRYVLGYKGKSGALLYHRARRFSAYNRKCQDHCLPWSTKYLLMIVVKIGYHRALNPLPFLRKPLKLWLCCCYVRIVWGTPYLTQPPSTYCYWAVTADDMAHIKIYVTGRVVKTIQTTPSNPPGYCIFNQPSLDWIVSFRIWPAWIIRKKFFERDRTNYLLSRRGRHWICRLRMVRCTGWKAYLSGLNIC